MRLLLHTLPVCFFWSRLFRPAPLSSVPFRFVPFYSVPFRPFRSTPPVPFCSALLAGSPPCLVPFGSVPFCSDSLAPLRSVWFLLFRFVRFCSAPFGSVPYFSLCSVPTRSGSFSSVLSASLVAFRYIFMNFFFMLFIQDSISVKYGFVTFNNLPLTPADMRRGSVVVAICCWGPPAPLNPYPTSPFCYS